MSFFFFYSQSSQIWSAPRVSWWCRGRRRSRRCGRHLQRWRTNTLNHKYSTKYCGDAGLVSFWYCVCCRWSCRMPGKILRAEEVEDLLRSSVTSRNYGATAWLRMYILYAKQSPVRHFVKMFFFFTRVNHPFYTNPPTRSFVHILMWPMLLKVLFNNYWGQVIQL